MAASGPSRQDFSKTRVSLTVAIPEYERKTPIFRPFLYVQNAFKCIKKKIKSNRFFHPRGLRFCDHDYKALEYEKNNHFLSVFIRLNAFST